MPKKLDYEEVNARCALALQTPTLAKYSNPRYIINGVGINLSQTALDHGITPHQLRKYADKMGIQQQRTKATSPNVANPQLREKCEQALARPVKSKSKHRGTVVNGVLISVTATAVAHGIPPSTFDRYITEMTKAEE